MRKGRRLAATHLNERRTLVANLSNSFIDLIHFQTRFESSYEFLEFRFPRFVGTPECYFFGCSEHGWHAMMDLEKRGRVSEEGSGGEQEGRTKAS